MTATTKIGEKNNRSHSENRRANKPLMEKRRRARINQSLSILKTLIVDSNKEKGQKPAKLEKADILELTVSHLQNLNLKKASEEKRFSEGYEECTKAAAKFFEKGNIDRSTVDKLINFLKFRHDSKQHKNEDSGLGMGVYTFCSDEISSTCSCVSISPTCLTENTNTNNANSKTNTLVNPPQDVKFEKSNLENSEIMEFPTATHTVGANLTRTVALTPVSLCPSPNDCNSNSNVSVSMSISNYSCSSSNSNRDRDNDDQAETIYTSMPVEVNTGSQEGQIIHSSHKNILFYSPEIMQSHQSQTQDCLNDTLTYNHNNIKHTSQNEEEQLYYYDIMDGESEPIDYSQPLDLCKNRCYNPNQICEEGVWRPW